MNHKNGYLQKNTKTNKQKEQQQRKTPKDSNNNSDNQKTQLFKCIVVYKISIF